MLAFAGIQPLYAQFVDINSQRTRTENTFNNPRPRSLRNNFDFLLANGNRLTLEFSNITQLQSLVNVDSLVAEVWKQLAPMHDSLKKPLVNRRVDFNVSDKGSQFRIVEHEAPGITYKYLNNELVQTKVEQDTLRIRLNTPSQNVMGAIAKPYFVMLVLNNISDVENLPENGLNAGIELLRNDVAPSLAKKQTQQYRTYYAMYDMKALKRISPQRENHFGYGSKRSLEPYVQLGVQYLRGAWAPSSGVGLQITNGYYNSNRQMFRLYWEPYFFFSRNASNNLITERNDFITFKYNEVRQRPNNFPTLHLNFSAGYLINRKGTWFEANSFKFALPGYAMRNVTIEPEFHFNKLFKNFSPSLRLTLEIE